MFSKFFNLLRDKYFWINAIIAGVLFFVTGVIILFSLKLLTKWGQSAVIPNVVNMSLEKGIDKIEGVGLDYEVKDTVYRKDLKEGTILEVQPTHGLEIKMGRTVYLVISSQRPPFVEMPNLVGRSSLRFAKIELETRGLVIGNLNYIPSPEKNAVLEQMIGGTAIKPGTLIPKGTVINLTLGDGLQGIAIDPPFLVGKSVAEARALLAGQGFIGEFFFDKDLTDTANGIVKNQFPAPWSGEKLNMGESMDIFIGKKIDNTILQDSAFNARLQLENATK